MDSTLEANNNMTQLTKEAEAKIREQAGNEAVKEAQNDLEGVMVMKPFRDFVLKALLQNVIYTSKKGSNKGQEVKKTMLNVPRLIGLINKADLNGVKFIAGGWGSNQTVELEAYDPSYTREV